MFHHKSKGKCRMGDSSSSSQACSGTSDRTHLLTCLCRKTTTMYCCEDYMDCQCYSAVCDMFWRLSEEAAKKQRLYIKNPILTRNIGIRGHDVEEKGQYIHRLRVTEEYITRNRRFLYSSVLRNIIFTLVGIIFLGCSIDYLKNLSYIPRLYT
jgi:hypothetical protein